MITLKNPYDSWLSLHTYMAAFETSRNHIHWTMGSILAIYPTYTSQECTNAMLFCHWDLSQHEKSMPPSLNWDGLPI